MCCRYWTDESPEMRVFVEEMNRSSLVNKWQGLAEVRTFGEIRPTNVAPVIAPDRSGGRAVFPMRWGFSGRTLLLNARTETAAQKPTFREAWERRRCIIPASWYFEWEHLPKDRKEEPLQLSLELFGDSGRAEEPSRLPSNPSSSMKGAETVSGLLNAGTKKTAGNVTGGRQRIGDKYRLWPKNSSVTYLCGLYRIENGLPVFVVLTREPGEGIRFLHDRMPLILPEECIKDWIHPGGSPEKLLPYALTDLDYENEDFGSAKHRKI